MIIHTIEYFSNIREAVYHFWNKASTPWCSPTYLYSGCLSKNFRNPSNLFNFFSFMSKYSITNKPISTLSNRIESRTICSAPSTSREKKSIFVIPTASKMEYSGKHWTLIFLLLPLKHTKRTLSHWDRDKMAAIRKRVFQTSFSCRRTVLFQSKFHKKCFQWVNKQLTSVRSDNGLVPNRRQAII